MIGKITGTDVLDEFEEDEEVEGSKMCRALENLKMQGRTEGLREGKMVGFREGEERKAKETAITLIEMGMPIEKIAKAVKMSEETVKGWLAEK